MESNPPIPGEVIQTPENEFSPEEILEVTIKNLQSCIVFSTGSYEESTFSGLDSKTQSVLREIMGRDLLRVIQENDFKTVIDRVSTVISVVEEYPFTPSFRLDIIVAFMKVYLVLNSSESYDNDEQIKVLKKVYQKRLEALYLISSSVGELYSAGMPDTNDLPDSNDKRLMEKLIWEIRSASTKLISVGQENINHQNLKSLANHIIELNVYLHNLFQAAGTLRDLIVDKLSYSYSVLARMHNSCFVFIPETVSGEQNKQISGHLYPRFSKKNAPNEFYPWEFFID